MADRDVLPQDVKPRHYDLAITDLEFLGNWTFQGKVVIDLDVLKATKSISLNTLEIKVHSATVDGHKGEISYDEKKQRATFTFSHELTAGSKSKLDIQFEGTMNNDMAGFYRAKYKPVVPPSEAVPHDDEHHYMFSTQFESTDARRAFPCFDEPNLKATFDFSIEVPTDLTALSNMPVKESKPSTKANLKIVSFDRSPIMSTYLLAYAVGDFEYIETFTQRKYNGKQLPVRVYTTRGLKEQGQWALDHAHKTIDYFSEIFQVDYPLPKSDMLAVHEFAQGAMENWGLITYRTSTILFDEKISDPKARIHINYVVAHELAHMWFGNLVTMDWWNELWLNEGFATWVGWLAVDKLHPEYEVWSSVLSDSMFTALALDGLRSSHPIEVPVSDALEINQVFDHISYHKGQSMIRMLSSYLGRDVFLSGVAKYLGKHAYGNARTADLWAAISEVSGQDIPSLMSNWIEKIGYPVLTVAEEPGQITIAQSRFLSSGDVANADDETIWWIPLGLAGGLKTSSPRPTALTQKRDVLRDIDDDFYKLNTDTVSFFRTNYPAPRLSKLGASRERLSVNDRIGLIGDCLALAVSGDSTTVALLTLLQEFASETHFLVWRQIGTALSKVSSVFEDNKTISDALNKFILALYKPLVDRIGWTTPSKGEYSELSLQASAIGMAGHADYQPVINEAKSRYAKQLEGDASGVPAHLGNVISQLAVTSGDATTFEKTKELFLKATAPDHRIRYLAAMGRTTDAKCREDYLSWAFAGGLSAQDIHMPAHTIASRHDGTVFLWKWIQDNWAIIEKKIGGNPIVLGRFLVALRPMADAKHADEVAAFFKDKDTKSFDKGLAQTLETIRANAAYKQRDEKVLEIWLNEKGYGKANL